MKPGGLGRIGALVSAVLLVMIAAGEATAQRAPLRVLSLDQCADQFALGLSAPDDVLFLSPRADDPDSRLRALARGRARVRPTLEAALVARPDVVIRSWGGDARLLRALEKDGVTVVQIDDAVDLAGVRRNVTRAGRALGREGTARGLVADMDRRLAGVETGGARPALYLTAGGFTAGPGTLIDTLMRAAGLSNLSARPGFAPVGLERLLLDPPVRLVLGFFEAVHRDWRGAGRHPVVTTLAWSVPQTRLDGAVAACPAWFVGEAVQQMRGARP